MGIISRLARPASSPPLVTKSQQQDGLSIWRRAFGSVDKESGHARPRAHSQRPGSAQRSVLHSNEASFIRLLQAMRSDAPGGWSEDRWEQTSKHFYGITYVAIHRLAMQMSRAEFQVFREDPDHPDGKRPVTRRDEAWELVQLLRRPNRQDSFGKLMYRWTQQKLLTGSALTWQVPNMFGKPYELYSIPTCLAIPQSTAHPQYPHGYFRIQPVYPYGPFSSYPTPNTAVGAIIPAQWMMKFHYPHPFLRYEGYAPTTGIRSHIDAIEMIDKARHTMMRRGIHPSAVLNSTEAEGTEELNDETIDRIRAMFEEDHVGPDNFGRLLVAYAGWKLEQWGNTPDSMLFEQGWDQLSSFILGGGFGITKPAAGMVEDSSYQTLFATMKQLHLITLEPECQDIGSELTRTLGPHWGDDVIVDVRLPRIDDHEVKFMGLDKALQGKCITKNELRKELGFPLTQEECGEEIAGTEKGQEQPGMPGAPGAPGAEQPQPGGGGEDPLAAIMGELGGEDEEAPREDAGSLSEGALGPRPGTVKALRQYLGDLHRPRRPALNGNGRH